MAAEVGGLSGGADRKQSRVAARRVIFSIQNRSGAWIFPEQKRLPGSNCR